MHREIDRLDIEAVLIHFGADWVPEGERWRKMRCILPGHDDRHPSAAVNRNTGKYACMACDVSEDGYGLIQYMNGCDFRAAAEYANTIPGARGEQPVEIGARARHGRVAKPPWLKGA